MFNIIPTPDDADDDQGGTPAAPRQVEQLPGGSLRVSTTPPAPAPAQVQQAPEPGVFRVTGGGVVEHSQHASVTITAAPSTGSVIATARGPGGIPTAHVTDDCTVELIPGNPASRTSIQVAILDGLVKRAAGGVFVDAEQQGQATAPADQEQAQRQGNTDDADIPHEEAIAFNQAAESIPQPIVDSATARVIAAVASGDPAAWEGAAVELARGAGNGLEPSGAAAVIQHGYNVMERAVARAVGPMIGGTSEEARQAFYGWIREHADRRELEQATTRLVYEKSVAGFKALAARYQRSRGQA